MKTKPSRITGWLAVIALAGGLITSRMPAPNAKMAPAPYLYPAALILTIGHIWLVKLGK